MKSTSKKFHLFVDYKYAKSVTPGEEPALLNALVRHQYNSATTSWQTFTALDPVSGYAYSQEYKIEAEETDTEPRKVSWRPMGKHERGVENPKPIPSFDALLKQAMTITLEQAANYFAASNLGIWGTGSRFQQDVPTCAADFDCSYKAIECLADGAGENEAERCWKAETASWRLAIRKEKKSGYCHTELAKLGFTIKK